MSDKSTTLTPDDPVFALLTAIVAVHFGEKARVRTVRLMPEPHDADGPIQPWALEGRRMIYASHRVR